MFESVGFQVHLEDDAVTDEAVDDRGMGTVVMESIHWVIAGGESGPGAQEIKAEWVRDLRDQCQIQRVAFFFKQWGSRTPKPVVIRWTDGSGWNIRRWNVSGDPVHGYERRARLSTTHDEFSE